MDRSGLVCPQGWCHQTPESMFLAARRVDIAAETGAAMHGLSTVETRNQTTVVFLILSETSTQVWVSRLDRCWSLSEGGGELPMFLSRGPTVRDVMMEAIPWRCEELNSLGELAENWARVDRTAAVRLPRTRADGPAANVGGPWLRCRTPGGGRRHAKYNAAGSAIAHW